MYYNISLTILQPLCHRVKHIVKTDERVKEQNKLLFGVLFTKL